MSFLVLLNGASKWHSHEFLILNSPKLLIQYKEQQKISVNILMDQKVCNKDHNKVEDFVGEADVWYLKEDQDLHGVRCIVCMLPILAKKDQNGFYMGLKKPIYVCSRRQQGCKAVYCGDCWGKAIVSLKRPRRSGVSLKPPRRSGRVQSNL